MEKTYTLRARGEYYKVNEKGEITTMNNDFSGQWTLFALVPRWNCKPTLFYQWENIKQRLEHGGSVQGYIFDMDHGTMRFWGGNYCGHLPKGKIWID